MKNIAIIALFIAASFIAAGPAPAQDHVTRASVPFGFTVGTSTLPAGTYTIRSNGRSPDVLSFNNPAAKVNAFSVGLRGDGDLKNQHELVFHKYADKYYLSEIRSGQGGMNTYFYPSKAEKRARAQALEAHVPASNPVLIAMN